LAQIGGYTLTDNLKKAYKGDSLNKPKKSPEQEVIPMVFNESIGFWFAYYFEEFCYSNKSEE
jgi:hypothetical protein